MFASTSMSAALDNLQFYPKVRCFHVLPIACLAALPTPSTSIGFQLYIVVSTLQSACLRMALNMWQDTCTMQQVSWPLPQLFSTLCGIACNAGHKCAADTRTQSRNTQNCSEPAGAFAQLPQSSHIPRCDGQALLTSLLPTRQAQRRFQAQC